MLELAAPFGGIREISIVAEGELALVAVDQDGLGVEQRLVAGCRVARVADGQVARKFGDHVGLENFFDFAHGAVRMQVGAVARNDPGRFLPAMLQCVKTEIGELGRLGMAEYAEDAAFVVEVVVEKDVRRGHGMCSARTSELAQASRRDWSGDWITTRP